MATKQERVRLLAAARNNPALQQVILEKCKRDPVYWFNHFCWTYDPRTEDGRMPFFLYPFQEERVIPEICAAIEGKADLLIEKSRDMGVSWLFLLVFQYYWLFHPGHDFLCGSRKEEYVDKLGNISTLFEKLRFNLKWLPDWMTPKGYDSKKHSLFMRLINPENGNVITGESSNQDFARGGRYSAVAFDEFPKWPFDDAAWGSAYQSTPCRIAIGTPYGKGNRFAKLAQGRNLDERIKRKLTIHWRDHPEKDDEWYRKECERATKDEIARELDISYEMSVAGTVFKEFNPQAHLIKTPYEWQPHWRNVAGLDFGTTCAAILGQIDDYDTLHVAKEIVLYQNGNTQDLGQAFLNFTAGLDLEKPWDVTCDPAGNARSGQDKEESTHIKVLAEMGIYPDYDNAQKMQKRLEDGIQMLKTMFSTRHQGFERILIYEDGCPTLLEAIQSEYRYKENANGETLDIIYEKHPWEDVMDCLRYIVIHKFSVQAPRQVPRAASPHARRNAYTGYRA